jgi:non-heme Fe2+,alpha-ketoglutarate-dependent halogenase
MMGKILTAAQQEFYRDNGYLHNLSPIFIGHQLKELNEGYKKLTDLLYEDEIPSDIQSWNQTSRWLYDIGSHPVILDYVEDILGPNFFWWGNEFITKSPHSLKTVPWHQDAYYWGTGLGNTVTVWLAFTDVDAGNGAMQVIPGTHKKGLIKHKIASEESILSFEMEGGTFSADSAVSLTIPAGAISLHDDRIIHGSPANTSDRWRIACISRYSSSDVKADLTKAPNFKAYHMRGVDYKNNPVGTIPTEMFARPDRTTKRIRKTQ